MKLTEVGLRPRTEPHDRLIAIGSGRWLADELSTNTLGVTITQSTGLILPSSVTIADADSTAWWMPCSFATRLLHSGAKLSLSAPGPFWLTEMPSELLGREIFLADVEQVRQRDVHIPEAGAFIKLAEAKDEDFTAQWRTRSALAADLMRAGLPPLTWLQWSPTQLDLSVEYRHYVLDDEVLTGSLYLRTEPDGRQQTYYDDARTDEAERADALAYAVHAAGVLAQSTRPQTYTLDVGLDRRSGDWVVVEANPVWSSAWYGCDIDSAVRCILAANQPDPNWEYVPDPVYLRMAERRGPLR